jgi:hypothetical protein
MTVPVLVCECGLRVKAPGATPGRVGRCPKCGGRLQVPESGSTKENKKSRPKRAPSEQTAQVGYMLSPAARPVGREAAYGVPAEVVPARAAYVERASPSPMTDGLLRPLADPERGWLPSFLYPLRGAESLGMIAGLSAVLWVITILVPEYCLTVMREADSMGADLMGKFIAFISFLPVVLVFPFVLFYWLQYLGRVLVASAMGETAPPRMPDRNFDGFLNGLSPWFTWLVLGVCPALTPLLVYWLSQRAAEDLNPAVALALAALAIPYIVVALMMSFLHDHALASTPWAVLGAVFRLGRSYLLLCLFLTCAVGAGWATFALALAVRQHHFWTYILIAPGCWILVNWVSIVAMRILGTYYFHRRRQLQWHHERPRWGVTWKL